MAALSRVHETITEPCAVPASRFMRLYARFVGVDRAKSALAVAHRQEVPILACVGSNGGGKSLCAVYTVLPTLRGKRWSCSNPDHLHIHDEDCKARVRLSTEPTAVCDCTRSGPTEGWRKVLSTVKLLDPETGLESPHYVPLRSFVTLLGAEHLDVVMDEVTGVASARAHQSLPVQVENLIVQLRRRDARLIWTTPDYGAADNRIRQVTQGVVYCRGFAAVEATEPGRVWRESRMFRWSLYDARDFDQFTAGKREKLRPRSTQWFWRPGHVAQDSYNTLAAVTQLGVAAEGGMCLSCGGSRSRAKCSCPPDPDHVHDDGIEETVTASGTRTRRRVLA